MQGGQVGPLWVTRGSLGGPLKWAPLGPDSQIRHVTHVGRPSGTHIGTSIRAHFVLLGRAGFGLFFFLEEEVWF